MAHQSHRSNAFLLDQQQSSPLACRAGCGFFGNREWLGYCSICFKQLNNSSQPPPPSPHYQHPQFPPPPPGTALGPSPALFSPQQQQQQQHQLLHQQQQRMPEHHQFQSHEPQPFYYMPTGMPATSNIANLDPRPVVMMGTPPPLTLINQQQMPSHVQPPQTHHRPINTSDLHQQQPTDMSASHSSTACPFDKYEEKRRSQYTDKRSNVLKLLRRASTFKDRSHSSSDTSPPPPPPPQQQQQQPTSHKENKDDTKSGSSNTISESGSANTSTLNPSNLFSNLTSPTALVMSGYDTITNLHNTIFNSAKTSFRGSPNTLQGDATSVHSVSQSEYLHNTSSSGLKIPPNQPTFLYDMAWVDCLRHVNKFAKEFLQAERQPDKSIKHLSEMVHEFYRSINDRFETQIIYRGATTDQIELLNDNIERILNEHIYQVISARIINEDEEHNMAIQKRIKSLNWITVEHLEIDIDFQCPEVHDLLDKAICQMIEMNTRTSSIDKLDCIVQCSKTIFELLQVRQRTDKNKDDENHLVPASADQFLPVLVFVVIQANPPMLPADMKYLELFSNPRRVGMGETACYFTHLCSALEFIEKASGASLNISEEEFTKYINGEAVPVTKSQFSTYLCDGLRTMCSNEASLNNLRQRHEVRWTKIESLQEQIDVHLETNRAKLREMEMFVYNLKRKLVPNSPKFYNELLLENKEAAVKLLPDYLKQSIVLCMESKSEARLVDIETDSAEQQEQQQSSIAIKPPSNLIMTNHHPDQKDPTSLSPVEQLESGLSGLKLPDPIKPEPKSPNYEKDGP